MQHLAKYFQSKLAKERLLDRIPNALGIRPECRQIDSSGRLRFDQELLLLFEGIEQLQVRD